MAGQIRIEGLARDLGKTNDDLFRALERLGIKNYHSSHQQIPEALARRVSAFFKISPAPPAPAVSAAPVAPPPAPIPITNAPALQAPEPEHLFFETMAAQGVKPLRSAPKSRRVKPGRAPSLAPSAAPVSSTLAPILEPASVPLPPAPFTDPVPVVLDPGPALALSEPALPDEPSAESLELDRLRQELTSLRVEFQASLARSEEIEERLRESLAARLELGALVQALGERLDDRPAASPVASEARVALPDLLYQRGLRGLDESCRVLRSLLESHDLDPLLPLLEVVGPARLSWVLDERLVLCCGLQGCRVPEGAIGLAVSPSRCDLCSDQSFESSAHRFSDACLLSGLTRILLVGGPSMLHRSLRELVDRRVQILFIPGSRPPPSERLALDLLRVQVALGWSRGGDPVKLQAALAQERVPVVLIQERSAGALLESATREILAMDVLTFAVPEP